MMPSQSKCWEFFDKTFNYQSLLPDSGLFGDSYMPAMLAARDRLGRLSRVHELLDFYALDLLAKPSK